MNRRQKMKRMKQELEWYKKQLVPTREVAVDSRRYDIVDIAAKQIFSKEEIMFYDEIDMIDILTRKVTSCVDEYIEFKGPIYKMPESPDGAIMYARLKVVVPHGGDRI